MRQMIFLLTKYCMSTESLPVYGNKYWKTPNIDAFDKIVGFVREFVCRRYI